MAFQSQCSKTHTCERLSGKQPHLLTRESGVPRHPCSTAWPLCIFPCSMPNLPGAYVFHKTELLCSEDTGIQNILSKLYCRGICFIPESQPLAQPWGFLNLSWLLLPESPSPKILNLASRPIFLAYFLFQLTRISMLSLLLVNSIKNIASSRPTETTF